MDEFTTVVVSCDLTVQTSGNLIVIRSWVGEKAIGVYDSELDGLINALSLIRNARTEATFDELRHSLIDAGM